MKRLVAFLTGSPGHSDQTIAAVLQNGKEAEVRRTENRLFEAYRDLTDKNPFIWILPDKRDREEAYLDACWVLVSNIKAGRFDEKSSVKTYFSKIFLYTCVRYARRNATNKSKPGKPNENAPSDELLKGFASDVHDKLNGLMSQYSNGLLDEALNQFRLSNYRCYYVLSLRDDMGFPYEAIVDFTKERVYQRSEDGYAFKLEELIEVIESEQKKLNFNNPDTVRNIASECRKELNALIERFKNPNQARP